MVGTFSACFSLAKRFSVLLNRKGCRFMANNAIDPNSNSYPI